MSVFLDIKDLPPFGTVVFCKWPKEPSENPSRRVLVIDSEKRVSPDGQIGGVVRVVYGSGRLDRPEASDYDLIFTDLAEAKLNGLTKPTRFYLCRGYIKNLLWKDDRFIAPDYIKNQGLVLGRLTPGRSAELQEKIFAFDSAQSLEVSP